MSLGKTKKQKILFFFLFSLMLLGFFGFNKVENAHAAATDGQGGCWAVGTTKNETGLFLNTTYSACMAECGQYTNATDCNWQSYTDQKTYTMADKTTTTVARTGQGACISAEGSMGGTTVIDNLSYADCTSKCKEFGIKNDDCIWQQNNSGITAGGVDANGDASGSKKDEICPGTSWSGVGSSVSSIINCFLLIILRFLAIILEAAAVLFNWIINPTNMTAIIDNKIIYTTWAMVRDVLNIAFILVLLFSAFSTVFQVDKYNYKNILKTLLIMALLVNFSYPITRFIIDFSNSMMYYLLNSAGASDLNSNFSETIAKESTLGTIIYQQASADTSHLLASVVFLWIFTVTILIIAGLFVIRAIALALLVIFSSLAFTGSIVPFLSNYSSQWWNNLFKYAFFGPVMIFMLAVATNMMKAINLAGYSNMKTIAGQQSSSPSIVASMSFFIIPIIILWAGIMFAQSMSLMGASAVINRGKSVAGWGVKTFSGAGFAMGAWGAYRSRRKEAEKDSWRNRLGTFVGSKQDQLRGVIPGRTGRDAELRYQRDLAQKVEAEAKRRDTANMTTGDLKTLSQKGNKFEKAAAIQELANRGQATTRELDNVRQSFGETSQVFKALANKVRSYDPVAAFSHISDDATRMTAMREFMNSNQFDAKKINASTLGNKDFMRLAFREQAISNGDLEDLRKKSIAHGNNIDSSLEAIVGGFSDLSDQTSPEGKQQQIINRNAQMAYFAQTGKIHSSISGNNGYTDQIFSRLNKDTMKRIKIDTINDNYDRIAKNMNISKYKEAMQNIDDRNAQRTLNRKIMDKTDAKISGDPEALALSDAVRTDKRLSNIK